MPAVPLLRYGQLVGKVTVTMKMCYPDAGTGERPASKYEVCREHMYVHMLGGQEGL